MKLARSASAVQPAHQSPSDASAREERRSVAEIPVLLTDSAAAAGRFGRRRRGIRGEPRFPVLCRPSSFGLFALSFLPD